MEDLVRLAPGAELPQQITDEALFHWADQRLRIGSLDETAVLGIAAHTGADSDALRDLRALVAEDGGHEAAGWWQAQPERRHVAAGTLRLAARRAEAEGRLGAAVTLLDRAMTLAPPVHAYESPVLKEREPAQLDAAIDLGRLFDRHRSQLDRDGGKVRAITSRLDAETRALDLARPGVGRYHQAFGVIYARQQDWEHARLHLDRSLRAEEALATKERREPLAPGLHQLLAEVAGGGGKEADAVSHSVAAAKQYLELGDARAARDALAPARPFLRAAPAQLRADAEALRSLSEDLDALERAPERERERLRAGIGRRIMAEPAGGSTLGQQWRGSVLRRMNLDEESAALRDGKTEEAEHLERQRREIERRHQLPELGPAERKRLERAKRSAPVRRSPTR
jgi:tetratricopeptide (TPR) repeat protein